MPDMNLLSLMELQTPLRGVGPAKVTSVGGRMVELDVDGRCVTARLAVPAMYVPQSGDEVLLLETGQAAYVIGVLEAHGPTTICAPGDLNLLAPNGQIMLAGEAVHAHAPDIRLDAKHLSFNADELYEGFRNVRRVVSALLDVSAGALRARVGELFSLKAKEVQMAAEEDVKIDGQQIHLG